ncbi:hypothetical protein ULMS_26060 [Patiriisocius marinistellae]|uniref:CarboxypepD_reg-like domain-containing protein n=2 Tax=Patiriisocius marinistellae TaxID=2494560 RepID=A0A5J4G095_9FLAO|nr:hypothetical protein ULMS_26060 [Patiriisocius marinistellae]
MLAQQEKIKGQLTNTVDVGGIEIMNETSGSIAFTDENGAFEIKADKFDVLKFSAINYFTFRYNVSRNNYTSKTMEITLEPILNELDEVNLSKNKADISFNDPAKDVELSYEELMFQYTSNFNSDVGISGTAANNAYHNGQTQNGLDLIGGAKLLKYVLFGRPEKNKTADQLLREKEFIAKETRKRFSDEYLMDNYDIPQEAIVDFFYYVQEDGVPLDYFDPKNELLLLNFMFEKSKEYLEYIEK